MDTLPELARLFCRWIQALAGMGALGLLCHVNLVQIPFFAETDATTRTAVIAKLVPRHLNWLQATVLLGTAALWAELTLVWPKAWSPSSMALLLAALLATVVCANVWLVLLPHQRVVVASARRVLTGGSPDPQAPVHGRRAALVSRSNLLFSLPLLLLVTAADRLSLARLAPAEVQSLLGTFAAVVCAIELNALLGLTGPGKRILDSLPALFACSFLLSCAGLALLWGWP